MRLELSSSWSMVGDLVHLVFGWTLLWAEHDPVSWAGELMDMFICTHALVYISSSFFCWGTLRTDKQQGEGIVLCCPLICPLLRKIVERLKTFRGSKLEWELKFCLLIYLRGFRGRLVESSWLLENDRGTVGVLLLLWPEVPEHVLSSCHLELDCEIGVVSSLGSLQPSLVAVLG